MTKITSFVIPSQLFLLLGALLCIFTSCGSTSTPQELYAQYYETPKFTETTKGIRHMEALKSVYDDSDFETAARLLEKVKINPPLRVYLGICHLELEQTNSAISIFNSLLTDPNTKHKATWYLALSHLQNSDNANCKTELSKLIAYAGDSPFKQKAKELLEKV